MMMRAEAMENKILDNLNNGNEMNEILVKHLEDIINKIKIFNEDYIKGKKLGYDDLKGYVSLYVNGDVNLVVYITPYTNNNENLLYKYGDRYSYEIKDLTLDDSLRYTILYSGLIDDLSLDIVLNTDTYIHKNDDKFKPSLLDNGYSQVNGTYSIGVKNNLNKFYKIFDDYNNTPNIFFVITSQDGTSYRLNLVGDVNSSEQMMYLEYSELEDGVIYKEED